MFFTQSKLPKTDMKGTRPSVCITEVSAYRGGNSIEIVSIFKFRANITTHKRELSVLLRLDCIRFAHPPDNLLGDAAIGLD